LENVAHNFDSALGVVLILTEFLASIQRELDTDIHPSRGLESQVETRCVLVSCILKVKLQIQDFVILFWGSGFGCKIAGFLQGLIKGEELCK
jgi:hypothetical protein